MGDVGSPKKSLTMPHTKLLPILAQRGIKHTLHRHKPVHTVDEAMFLTEQIPGAHSKNLFLKTKKKDYFLVSIRHDKRADLKALSDALQTPRFSFCNPEELAEMLGVVPGSVTPYGLINDTQRRIRYFLDRDLLEHETVNFHPLQNDMTLSIATHDFLEFIKSLGYEIEVIGHQPSVFCKGTN